MTQAEILEKVINKLPYPNQVHSLDLTKEPDAIRFIWRGHNLRISNNLSVEEIITTGFLTGTDIALLIEHILQT
jgi:hypothetical protein